FLWLATQGGLHRYDGHDFKVYAASPFDTTSLLSNTITSVSVARDGMVWAGTSAGLIRLDPENGRTVHFAHDPSNSAGLSNHFLIDVLVARNGDVWVAVSDGGLHRMRAGQENVFDLYGHDPNDPSSMSSDDVQYLSEDAEGFIWCGSANGMNRIDPEIG